MGRPIKPGPQPFHRGVRPNPSLERDLHRHGTWPARRSLSSSSARARRHPGSGPSAQTLGLMSTHVVLSLLLVTVARSVSAAPASREECRASTQTEDVMHCIQAKLYDPCDDAGGKWGQSQCAWAHAEIAERRVKSAEQEIVRRLAGARNQAVLAKYQSSQRHWRSYRETYCRFADATVDLQQFKGSSDSHLGYCWRRLTEQRATELEATLGQAK